jgi:hypothetical protein
VKGTSYIETGGMSGDINKKRSVLFKPKDLLEKRVTLERGIFRKMGLGMQVGRESYLKINLRCLATEVYYFSR